MGSVHLSPNNPLGSGKTWLEANDFFVLHKCEMLKTSKLWIIKKLNFVNYISYDRLYANNLQIFLCTTYAIRFLMSKAFQKAKNYQNLATESGSKQRFSLLQEKVLRQCARGLRQLGKKPGFIPKGRAMAIQEKYKNVYSLRPILLELCEQNYRVGSNWKGISWYFIFEF